MDSLIEIFCDVDDFIPILEKHMLGSHMMKRRHARLYAVNEVMTILVHFH